MRGRRREPVAAEDAAHLGGRVIEVSGELDLAIADPGHVRERALEILLHRIPDGVELDADRAEPVLGGTGEQARERRGAEQAAGGGAEKATAVDHRAFRFIWSTAWSTALAVSAM